VKIDASRLWETLMETARIGGTAEGGICRLTLSDEDRAVRAWLRDQAKTLGLSISIDRVGNMFLRREGLNPAAAPIAMGSHLDTQPAGGKFDGILGVLAGLEVMRTLDAHNIETEHPLQLVNWTNEEGARFAPAMLGSAVYAGTLGLNEAIAQTDSDGVRFNDALTQSGCAGETEIGTPEIGAMFELHIEQGPVLEHEAAQIGVVTGVQAARWYDIVLTGRAAHAGSTPMNVRADALLSATHFITDVTNIAKFSGGYATVGEFTVTAQSRNVVAGEVRFSLDLRHHDDHLLGEMEHAMHRRLSAIEGEISSKLTPLWVSPSVQFDTGCISAIREAAENSGLSWREIVSGAGHDAVNISRVAPTAMIFVPCKDGLSHNPAESATPEDCAAGAQVLLDAVLGYDARGC
jgi:N-carbamoyl-L-amino-acid hydrolase